MLERNVYRVKTSYGLHEVKFVMISGLTGVEYFVGLIRFTCFVKFFAINYGQHKLDGSNIQYVNVLEALHVYLLAHVKHTNIKMFKMNNDMTCDMTNE